MLPAQYDVICDMRSNRTVNMNFSQLGKIQELKGHMDTFRRNHPKFPMFLGAVAQNAVEEAQSSRSM